MLRQRGLDARYTIAGGFAPFNPNAIDESQMTQALAGSPVDWPGQVTDVAALYGQASVAVLPSYYGEGVPKSLLEAAASGLPIITAPLTLGAGQIVGGALELSNVDLAREFIGLVTASTGFSASGRVISVSDELLQELMVLVR